MPLRATLDVAVDGVVRFAFRVENVADDAVVLNYRTGQRADVTVSRVDDGEVVWRWSEGRMFTHALAQDSLPAGEERTFELEWPDPAPGEYVAEAELTAEPGVTASTSFVVEDGGR